jgi:cysteine desulfurase / selenocysteine lyase
LLSQQVNHIPIDVARARRETPGVQSVLHFNNAGAALMPQPVLDSIVQHLELEANIGGYEAADQQIESVNNVYKAIARLINCPEECLAIVENATRAWDMAFYGLKFEAGERILTGMAEYSSNYVALLQMQKRCGVEIEIIPNDEFGQISLSHLENAIDKRVKLISLVHVPTNGGLVNPAKAVGKLAKQSGAIFLLDACQSIGQMPVDVEELGCDILSATGRKFLRGPRGTGFLFVTKKILDKIEPPFLDLHAVKCFSKDNYELQEDGRRFENWETNYSTKIGLGKAVDYALAWGLENIENRVVMLANLLREQLSKIPGISVHDAGEKKCGIVTFNSKQKHSADEITQLLNKQRINVSVSRVGYSIDMHDRKLTDLVRASVHYYNDESEIETFCKTIESIC